MNCLPKVADETPRTPFAGNVGPRVAGERAAALTALTEAIDLGTRDPRLGQDTAFAELHDDPAFQAQIRRMFELINIERGKLGMAPLHGGVDS